MSKKYVEIEKTAGGSTTGYSSSGREHGGNSGSFGGAGQEITGNSGASPSNTLNKTGSALNKTEESVKKTPGTGGSVQSVSGGGSAPRYDTAVPDFFGETEDEDLVRQYEDAMAALETMKKQAPTYGSRYDAQIQSLYEQILGRSGFRYDPKTDPLYQQYAQDYTAQGKQAMRDTMGKAAALTGGYGSSYAQAVGQQQYDAYLQRLADVLPQTYGMALDAYRTEGERLNETLGVSEQLERDDYQKYLDALGQHNLDVQRAQNDADTAYERMTEAEKTAYARQLDSYGIANDYYRKLVSLIAMGYKPTKADCKRAGISQAQGAALRASYLAGLK